MAHPQDQGVRANRYSLRVNCEGLGIHRLKVELGEHLLKVFDKGCSQHQAFSSPQHQEVEPCVLGRALGLKGVRFGATDLGQEEFAESLGSAAIEGRGSGPVSLNAIEDGGDLIETLPYRVNCLR